MQEKAKIENSLVLAKMTFPNNLKTIRQHSQIHN